MADSYIWGNLVRATTDPTLIDEAITDAIVAHNDDPDAHVGEGQALESHRAAEIIDHRAESVVNDKIRRTARRYVAIVDPSSEFDFDTLTEAINYATSVGGGDIFIKRGTHYMTGSVDMPPTISLYGEGMGETVLESTSSGGSGLFYYTETIAGSGYGLLNASLNGLDSFKWGDYMDSTAPPVVGMFLAVYGAMDTTLEITGYNAVTDIVTLSDAFFDLGEETEAEALCGFRLTNSSSELQVLTNDTTGLDKWYAGMSADLDGLSVKPQTVERIDSTTFLLAAPYTGTTTLRHGWLRYLAKTTINFEGISTRRGNYRVLPSGNPGDATYVIQSCENFYPGFGGNVYYQGCLFDAMAGQTISLSGSSVWEKCTFRATAHNSAGFTITGRGALRDCDFLANGYSNHRWLQGVCHQVTIDGCRFENQEPAEIFTSVGGANGLGLRMSNCWWTFGSSGTFAMRLVRSVVTGCSFEMGSANAPQLSASSQRSIFAQNRCSKTPVNNGTNNLMVNNLVIA